MSRFPVRWSELLLFSVFSRLFVNWNSSFPACSVLQCKVPLCFYNPTPTLCFHCFLLSFLCSFSPCLPPPTPLLLSLRLRCLPQLFSVAPCALCCRDRTELCWLGLVQNSVRLREEDIETEWKRGERVRFVLTRADWINSWKQLDLFSFSLWLREGTQRYGGWLLGQSCMLVRYKDRKLCL